MNQGKRQFETLDVVKMFATLTEDHWRSCLESAASSGNTEKLKSWRYGMQAGLADAASKGLLDEKLSIWVFKRIRNLEQVMKWILRKRHPMPGDVVIPKYAKGQRIDYVQDAKKAKKARDREFEQFLKESNF